MTTTDRVSELLDGASWACSWGYYGGLAAVCHELVELVEPDLASRAARIEHLALEDMPSAAEEWRKLGDDICRRQALRDRH